MDNTKEFVVSVGDAMGLDIDTKNLIFDADTNIKTDFKLDSSSKEIKGGKGSQIQYVYNYDKKLTASIEDSQVKESYIALSNGVPIVEELAEFFNKDEEHEVKNGNITLDEIPSNTKVFVKTNNGEKIYTKEATGNKVNIPEVENGEIVYCTYQIKESMDTISIDGDKFGKTIKLVLKFTMSKQDADNYKEVEITIPRFKITSKVDLALQHDGVSTSKIEGKAMSFGKNHYAKIKIREVNKAKVSITAMNTQKEIVLNKGEKYVPVVYGTRGGVYAPSTLKSDLYTITSEDSKIATVTPLGEISYVAEGETMLTFKLKDNEHIKEFAEVICNPIS